MGAAILQVRELWKRSRCKEEEKHTLCVCSASGQGCPGGGGAMQSWAQRRSGLEIETEQSPALESI